MKKIELMKDDKLEEKTSIDVIKEIRDDLEAFLDMTQSRFHMSRFKAGEALSVIFKQLGKQK